MGVAVARRNANLDPSSTRAESAGAEVIVINLEIDKREVRSDENDNPAPEAAARFLVDASLFSKADLASSKASRFNHKRDGLLVQLSLLDRQSIKFLVEDVIKAVFEARGVPLEQDKGPFRTIR